MSAIAKMSIVFVGDTIAGRKIVKMIEDGSNTQLVGISSETEARPPPDLVQRLPFIPTSALRSEDGAAFVSGLSPDIIINFNSTVIFPPNLLKTPRLGAVNFHPGPLPERAGLNVGQWAVFEGDIEFGVTLHWMDNGIDTGKIIAQSRFPISANETGLTLHLKSLSAGIKLVTLLLADLEAGNIPEGIEQNSSNRKYYGRKAPNDGFVDFSWPNAKIMNLVRALSYRPFRSPTSPPKARIYGEELEIVEMEAVSFPPGSNSPGTVLSASHDGIKIATSDGAVILRRVAKGSEILVPEEIAATYRLNVETHE
jgi:methionyl-tRNA formyltransferase